MTKKNLKLARTIVASATESGQVKEDKLRPFLRVLKDQSNSQSKQVTKGIVRILEKLTKENTLLVETPFPLEEAVQKEILEKFERSLNKKLTLELIENKSLIGGLKISNEDSVWENTVGSNLEQLKGDFLHG